MEAQVENKLRYVWDPLLRGLHWWIALTTFIQVGVGALFMFFEDSLSEGLEDTLIDIHGVVGYLFGAGILVRILWLFIGPPTASWRDMVPIKPPQRKVFFDTIKFYLSFLRGKAPLYKAHNTFAGPIYLAFFFVAALQITSGVMLLDSHDEGASVQLFSFAYAYEGGDGLLDENNDGGGEQDEESFFEEIFEEIFEEAHEVGFFVFIFFIFAHIFAVLVHEFAETHRIIFAMFHGKKRFTDEEWKELEK
ncbi:MAG: cytochrome b/b6 domain-containing protein [Deltaproteobacteria bacterium]|nr:cytochrome b/b6 domain-containing protein [Deltaproteobacteria bacterium]